jgi:hypothetical protein
MKAAYALEGSASAGPEIENELRAEARSARNLKRILWLEQRGKRLAVTPQQKKLESGKNQGRREAFWRHQRMKDQDVEDDGSENCQRERNEAPDQEKQTTDQLERPNDTSVTTVYEHAGKVSGKRLRDRRHGNEM